MQRMALDHVLLGLLRTPASGYDLRAAFAESVGHFWHAELSQIYPTLARLEGAGLLRMRAEASGKGPPRKVYSLTARGRAELRAWLAAPIVGMERLEWLAQVFFLTEAPARALPFFRALRAEHARELAALEAIDAHWLAQDPAYPDVASDEDFYPQLTLALGLKKIRTIVEWCDECIQRLEKRR